MPCVGGHFGTMVSNLVPICERHNCTVVELAKICEQKLKPFHELVKFQVIKKHVCRDEYTFHGSLDFFLKFCHYAKEVFEKTYNEFSNILQERRSDFDIMLVDQIFWSLLAVAEKYDLPAIVQVPGITGGLEHVQDKMPIPVIDGIVFKLVFNDCWNWLHEKRKLNGLPEIDVQGQFSATEYVDRFPMFIPTSPSIYKNPHPNSEFVFIGGFRNSSNHQQLENKMTKWIDESELDIVYVSLGTHAALDEAEMKKFYEKVQNQNKYRIIWSLGLGLQTIAKNLGIFFTASEKIYFSDYLPQYKLLGHPKVKLAVSHAGLGTMIDLIKRRKPSILAPQFYDQFMNTIIMEKLDLGISISSLNFEEVDSAITKVMSNYDHFTENLAKIDEEFLQYENFELINDFIVKIAERKKISVRYLLGYEVNSPRVYSAWRYLQLFCCVVICGFFIVVLMIVKKCCYHGGMNEKKQN